MFNEQMISAFAPTVLKSFWKDHPPEDVQKEFNQLVELGTRLYKKINKRNKERNKASEKCTHDQYDALLETMGKIAGLCHRNGFIECEDLKKQILLIMEEGQCRFNSIEEEYIKKFESEEPEATGDYKENE